MNYNGLKLYLLLSTMVIPGLKYDGDLFLWVSQTQFNIQKNFHKSLS